MSKADEANSVKKKKTQGKGMETVREMLTCRKAAALGKGPPGIFLVQTAPKGPTTYIGRNPVAYCFVGGGVITWPFELVAGDGTA